LDTAPNSFVLDAKSVNTYDRTTTYAPKGWTIEWNVN
jgi:hypothetical protein